MKQFTDLVRHIKENGVYKADRTGTGTYSVFGHQMRFDLSEGFPVVTEKATHLKSIIHELLWFLQGDTNIRYLKANGVSIWDEWVDPDTAVYRELTVQERLLTISPTSDKAPKVAAFFEKYKGRADLEAYAYTLRKSPIVEHETLLLNRDGYTFLPDFLDKLGVDDKVLEAGELGPVYGKQWRSWPNVVRSLKGINLTIAQRCEEANKYGDYYLKLGQAYSKVGQARSEALSLLSKELDKLGIPNEKMVDASYSQGIDQIKNVVEMIKTNPDSRRLIVSAWNPAQVDVMALPPCHALFQFYSAPMSVEERYALYKQKMEKMQDDVHRRAAENPDDVLLNAYPHVLILPRNLWKNDESAHEHFDGIDIPRRKLSCQLYQRSADVFLGVPFNIASYALLTHMVAHVTDHAVGDFVWTGGDCHLYKNHMEQVDLLLSREALPLPTLVLNEKVKDIFEFTYDDIKIENYQCHPAIKAPVAV